MREERGAGRRCPICREGVAGREENPAFPFCGERCRRIDLGNWLGESYRVPAGDAEPDARESGAREPGED